jgi:5-methyltetrahydrofolate--homocysteine methyltransferase
VSAAISSLLGNEVVVLDGSMGAFLMAQGLPAGTPPDLWNLQRPEAVVGAHRLYVDAGAQVILTNTFGATAPRLEHVGAASEVAAINRAAVRNAREAGAPFVAGDVGSLGLTLEPAGDLGFETAVELFAEQIRAQLEAGVDLLILETFLDLAELRAAVVAANELRRSPGGDVPLIASMTFGPDGVSDTGVTPEAAAVTLQGLGVTAVGVNCSTGPQDMLPVVKRLASATALPIAVQPNAGLPREQDGELVFPMQPAEMAPWYERFVDAGAAAVGGCCGTTPETIRLAARSVGGRPVKARQVGDGQVRLASRSRVLSIGPGSPLCVIGERVNPTGKPKFAAALQQGRLDRVLGAARVQAEAGASALDVNVGVPDIDEPRTMAAAVAAVQNAVDLPLSLDSSDPAALKRGLEVFTGRALVNSVNAAGDPGETLALVRKHGAAVLLLPTGEVVPEDVAGRMRYARTLVDRALELGLRREDLIVDVLALAAAAMQDGAAQALAAARAYREELGVASICGLSNISFGLPQRKLVNRTFLSMAIAGGLDAVIADPLDTDLMNTRAAASLFGGRDDGCARFLQRFTDTDEADGPAAIPAGKTETPAASVLDRLGAAVVDGDRDAAAALAGAALEQGHAALDLLLHTLTPGIQRLGDLFAERKRFIPHLVAGAEAMLAAVQVLQPHLRSVDRASRGTVVFGTVSGDVHDIGKNICVLMLRSFGYDVVDLGRSVTPEQFVAAAAEHDADVVAMSALMTTTMGQMATVIDALATAGSRARTVVGGAVVTPEAAQKMGAGAYGKDAGSIVDVIEGLLGRG